MNLFNCFQAMAFYTVSPFLAQWLFANDYNVGGWLVSLGVVAGYVILSGTIYDKGRS